MATGGPNQTATPLPVQDFTPQKTYPSFSTIINQYYNPTTYTGTTNTLLYSDVLAGLIILTNGSAITATLPTATLMNPQIEGGSGTLPGVAKPATPVAGSGVLFFVKAGGAGAITVSAGTGGTLIGTGAVTAGSTKVFLLIITDTGTISGTPTYTVYSLGQMAQ